MRSFIPLFVVPMVAAAPALATETVPVAAFRSVQLRGGGEVTVVPASAQRVTMLEGSSRYTRMQVQRDGELRIDACVERCPQHYRLRIEIQSPRVHGLSVSGGGLIATRGSFAPQSNLSVAVNGGGRIDAQGVQAGTVSAAVNGGGEAVVNARNLLAAAINGGGMVSYVGRPQIQSAIHGGGLDRWFE